MRRVRTEASTVAAAVVVSLLLACDGTPTDTTPASGGESVVTTAAAEPAMGPPFLGPVIHAVRINEDGTLGDGSAIASSLVSNGVYHVEFASSIRDCTAVANSALFDNSGPSQLLNAIQISIGWAPGLVLDDESVTVTHRNTQDPDNFNANSAFTLLLVCPR